MKIRIEYWVADIETLRSTELKDGMKKGLENVQKCQKELKNSLEEKIDNVEEKIALKVDEKISVVEEKIEKKVEEEKERIKEQVEEKICRSDWKFLALYHSE
ncbi:hypothetical protein TNCV_4532701 [Trichonephila clavipes]|nr:hypothetical protein TNCV_4532701 [Trichonephila clavipes]